MTQVSRSDLATRLRDVRELRGLSLRAVAEPAGISPAYLQKLERGAVESPSPHALHGLAEVLDTPYEDLMALAGYVVPGPADETRGPMLIAGERSSERLDADEARQLAEYLAFLRHQRRHGERR
jgi:HTH-type transcriptional regulator, competence development regulator